MAEVVERTKGQPNKVLLRELREAYPFGSRAPARIWASTVRRYTKLRLGKADPRQLPLFEEG